jgi:hypothetical protein
MPEGGKLTSGTLADLFRVKKVGERYVWFSLNQDSKALHIMKITGEVISRDSWQLPLHVTGQPAPHFFTAMGVEPEPFKLTRFCLGGEYVRKLGIEIEDIWVVPAPGVPVPLWSDHDLGPAHIPMIAIVKEAHRAGLQPGKEQPLLHSFQGRAAAAEVVVAPGPSEPRKFGKGGLLGS